MRIFITAIFIISAGTAQAKTITCKMPVDCLEIISSEYSTGGGKSAIQLNEVTCKTKAGYSTYMDEVISAGSVFGFGRISFPDVIKYRMQAVTGDEMDCG